MQALKFPDSVLALSVSVVYNNGMDEGIPSVEGEILMRNRVWMRWAAGVVFLAVLFTGLLGAGADGVTLRMPDPPDVPVYWQLIRIDQEREVTPGRGHAVEDELHGLTLDLTDGLLMESELEADGGQGLSLTVKTDDATVMEHTYRWTPLPIYLEPDTDYMIDVAGTAAIGGLSPNTLLGIYTQGDSIGRISAGGYTGHDDQISFTLNTNDIGIYQDGRFVVSIILRDVNDMYRNRIVFTYAMHEGARPQPTPVPGFVAAELPEGTEAPAYYVPAPGMDGVWRIVTAPDQYRAFGVMSGAGPYFFPSDAQGNVIMNETPADPQADFDAYVWGFVAEDAATVPPYYALLPDGRFALTTRDGESVFRVFGRVDGGEPAFYPAGEDGAVAEGAEPVEPAEDFETYIKGFGAAAPENIPAHYQVVEGGVYAFDGRDGVRRWRVYGRLDGAEPSFYPADAQGALQSEQPEAVDPQSDFELYIKGFDPAPVQSIPDFYTSVGESLYVVVDREGGPVYRAYGVKDGAEAAFYPSDEDGEVSEDAVPVMPEDDFAAYIAGFEPMEPEQSPDYYETTAVPGVWAFIDKEDEAQYRAYGSLDRGEPSFYPSDVEGNVAPDALPVQPASDLALIPQPVFAPAEPQTVPAHYEIVDAEKGLYRFTDLAGVVVYRVYGGKEDGEAAFYPSDEEGNIQSDDRVDPQEDAALLAVSVSWAVSTPQPMKEGGQTPLVRTQSLSTAMPISFVAGVATAEPTPHSKAAVTRMIAALPEAVATEMPATILAAITQQLPQATGTPVPVARIVDSGAEEAATPEKTEPAAADPTPESTEPAGADPTPESTEPAGVESAEAETVQPQDEPTPAVSEEQPQATTEPEPEAAQGLGTGGWIALAAIVLVAAGVVLYMLLRKRKERS